MLESHVLQQAKRIPPQKWGRPPVSYLTQVPFDGQLLTDQLANKKKETAKVN